MAEYGWYYCQEALIVMSLIHPLTAYKPEITDEYRQEFNVRMQARDPIRITIYEQDGKLIMGEDWEAYWVYRETLEPAAYCVLVGHFNKVPGLEILARPYMIGPHKAGVYGSALKRRSAKRKVVGSVSF